MTKQRLQDDSGYFGSGCHSDLRQTKSSAVVSWNEIVARFALRLIRLANADYSWTIRSPQLADKIDDNAEQNAYILVKLLHWCGWISGFGGPQQTQVLSSKWPPCQHSFGTCYHYYTLKEQSKCKINVMLFYIRVCWKTRVFHFCRMQIWTWNNIWKRLSWSILCVNHLNLLEIFTS